VPGHTLRSVYPDRGGEAILSLGSARVDQTTDFNRRWGGWYVTGTHGKQVHLGNLIVKNKADRETIANNPDGQNVTSLKGFLDPAAYLTPHSDMSR
jgi:starvation-inducible outer membrane lipoprotein